MAVFRTCKGLYPYDVYNIGDGDIDKPEAKGNEEKTLTDLRTDFDRYSEDINLKKVLLRRLITNCKKSLESRRNTVLLHSLKKLNFVAKKTI